MATVRKSGVRFRERAELLDFLLEVSAATSESLDLDRILENVGSIVRNVIPHDLFAILLYNEKAQGLSIRHSRGHRAEVVQNLIVPLGEGITGIAAQTRQPVMVGDVRQDGRYLNALDAVRSELAVPMLAGSKLVGVLDLQSTTGNAFSQQDSALLQLIASRIAAAIQNARLYRRVERQNRTQRTLALLAQEFSSILQLDHLLDKIAKSIRVLINYDAFIILLVDEKQGVLRSRFSLRFDERVQMESLPLNMGLTGAAASTRQPVLARDTRDDARYVESHHGIRSEMAIPLVLKDRVVGVMDLESERVNYFNEEHVRTLQLIAPQIASAVENARLYEQLAEREKKMNEDLQAARQLQAVLLPSQPPKVRGLRVAFGMKAALTVTGDLYDIYEYEDGDVMFAFGDSSGKGAAAALYGALLTGLLRTQAPRRRSPGMLLKSLNEAIMERAVETRYVTLLAVLWQPGRKRMVLANAGAATPLVCRGEQILTPTVAGFPIGLLEEGVEYEEKEFQVESDDVIALFSDGIQDQTNAEGEEYAKHRFPETLRALRQLSPPDIVQGIFDDVRTFRAAVPMHDDQTLMILKVDE